MSELSPSNIEKRAQQIAEHLAKPDTLTDSAIFAIDILPHTVKVDPKNRSERYAYPKWRVSEPFDLDYYQRPYGVDIEHGIFRLGYPIIRGQEKPEAVHIIYNDNFGLPWATTLGNLYWEQQIEETTDDGPLSENGQRAANFLLDKITSAAKEALVERKTRRRIFGKRVVALATAAAVAAGGFMWNDARVDRNNAKAAAAAAAVDTFDAQWANELLTEQPITPSGEFEAATEGPLPTGLPFLSTTSSSESSSLSFSEQLVPGMVRGIKIDEGCHDIPVELSDKNTVSVLTPPTIDSVEVALKPDANEIKICVNPVNDSLGGQSKPVAIQITPIR